MDKSQKTKIKLLTNINKYVIARVIKEMQTERNAFFFLTLSSVFSYFILFYFTFEAGYCSVLPGWSAVT